MLKIKNTQQISILRTSIPKLDFSLFQYTYVEIINPKVNMVVSIGINNRYIIILGNSGKKVREDDKVAVLIFLFHFLDIY